jgi:aminoglycoside phosphotransferase family enzyme
VIANLKEKLYLVYSQNFSKVGLLTNYKNECLNQKMVEKQQAQAVNVNILDFVSCQWKVNVVLSTNTLNKVLRPEVYLEIQTAQNEKIQIVMQVEKFEELRRQVAQLLRYAQQIECIRYLNM